MAAFADIRRAARSMDGQARILVYLSPQLHAKLRWLAFALSEAGGRRVTMSGLVREAVEEYMEKRWENWARKGVLTPPEV